MLVIIKSAPDTTEGKRAIKIARDLRLTYALYKMPYILALKTVLRASAEPFICWMRIESLEVSAMKVS